VEKIIIERGLERPKWIEIEPLKIEIGKRMGNNWKIE
jgi:hypothetical protein